MAQAGTKGPPTAVESHDRTLPKGRWAKEPSEREILLLMAVAFAFFLLIVAPFSSLFSLVRASRDNTAYMSIACSIRHWEFQGLVVKAFWGLPYVMAAVSMLTRITDLAALLVVSYCSCLAAIVLACRLWGRWIAGFFAVLNFDWIQRSFLGGTEPLFAATLFGAFFFARRGRWLVAALLASLATTIRPLGIFALVAIGLVLLWKRELRNFSLAVSISLAVGGLYVTPLALYFNTPLANVYAYQQGDWEGGRIFAWPASAILHAILGGRIPWTNLLSTLAWILFVLIGSFAMILNKECRQQLYGVPAEMIFAISYSVFLFTYNSPRWIGSTFPRLAIPILPFILLALKKWLPMDRRLLWGIAIASPVLTATYAVGPHRILQVLSRHAG